MAEGAFQKQVAHAALIVFLIMMALMALMMAKFKEPAVALAVLECCISESHKACDILACSASECMSQRH